MGREGGPLLREQSRATMRLRFCSNPVKQELDRYGERSLLVSAQEVGDRERERLRRGLGAELAGADLFGGGVHQG